MAKRPQDEPRRVESPAKMTMTGEDVVVTEPVMREAEPAFEVSLPPDFQPSTSSFDLESSEKAASLLIGQITGLATLEAERAAAAPHNPMSIVPRDGTMVNLIRADGSEVRVVWRSTRQYNARAQQWERTGFWTSPMNRVPLHVDAVGWSLGDGFLTPFDQGMVMT